MDKKLDCINLKCHMYIDKLGDYSSIITSKTVMFRILLLDEIFKNIPNIKEKYKDLLNSNKIYIKCENKNIFANAYNNAINADQKDIPINLIKLYLLMGLQDKFTIIGTLYELLCNFLDVLIMYKETEIKKDEKFMDSCNKKTMRRINLLKELFSTIELPYQEISNNPDYTKEVYISLKGVVNIFLKNIHEIDKIENTISQNSKTIQLNGNKSSSSQNTINTVKALENLIAYHITK